MKLAVMVHESDDAAPALLLSHELAQQGAQVATKTASGAALAIERQSAILRVVPHPDLDDCGFHGKHAAYTVTWAIPKLCNAAPPLRLPATAEEAARLWGRCWDCGENLWLTGNTPLPSGPHVTWWDVSEPTTLRAREIPPAVRIEKAVAESISDPKTLYTEAQLREMGGLERARERFMHSLYLSVWTDQSAHQYDWVQVAEEVLRLGQTEGLHWDRMAPEQQLALVGCQRSLQYADIAATERRMRELMRQVRVNDPGTDRLSALSGIPARRVPEWVNEGGSQATPGPA